MISDEDELLTTGEAARLLGCSRQHVTDLCRRGTLPYRSVGTHRRIRRGDLTQLADRGRPAAGHPLPEEVERERWRSLWLHRAVAGRVAADPQGVLSAARRNLERAYRLHPRSRPWLDAWDALLDDPEVTMETLTAADDRAVEMRSNTPFAGALEEDERARMLAAFGRWWRERDAQGAPGTPAARSGPDHR